MEGFALEVDALGAEGVAFPVFEQRHLLLLLLGVVEVERLVVENGQRVVDELVGFLLELLGALALFVARHELEERVLQVDGLLLRQLDVVLRAVAHELLHVVAGELELENHFLQQPLDQTAELRGGGQVELGVSRRRRGVLGGEVHVFLEHLEDEVLELFDEAVEVGRGEPLVEEEDDVVFDEGGELVEGDLVDEDERRVVCGVPGGVEAFDERVVDGVDGDQVDAGPAVGVVALEELVGEDVVEGLDQDVWLEHLVVLDVEEAFVELLEVAQVDVLERVDLHLDQVFGVFRLGLDVLCDPLEVLAVLCSELLRLADLDQVDVGLVDLVLCEQCLPSRRSARCRSLRRSCL